MFIVDGPARPVRAELLIMRIERMSGYGCVERPLGCNSPLRSGMVS